MSSLGYKPRELFRRTMLARVPNPRRNDTECREDSQGNSLAAGVEQVSDDVELTAESLNKTDGLTGGVVLDSAASQKGKEKWPIIQTLWRERRKNWHGRPKPLRYSSNT